MTSRLRNSRGGDSLSNPDTDESGALERATPRPAERKPGGRISLGRRIDLWRDRIEATVTGLLLGGAILLVVYTVTVRYFAPDMAPLFTNEITVYMVIWATLLAAGGITHAQVHVSADLVTHFMSPRMRHWSDIAANLSGVIFALFLLRWGYQIAYDAWFFNDLSPTSLRFPLWIYYASLPVAGLLMAIGHLRVAIELVVKGPAEDLTGC